MTEHRQWLEADLQRLADDKEGETLQLEFKACGAVTKHPDSKAEIGKDLSAMANAAGGVIIYGIAEKNRAADRIDTGFDPNVYTKEWLEQVIDSNVQPRIEGLHISVVRLPSRGNNVAYVVDVPQAVNRAPHQASDKRYYKRANYVNQMMEDYEIRDALRRARTPDLHVAWTPPSQRIDEQRRVINLNVVIGNNSSEPSHFSLWRLYLDEAFKLTGIDRFQPNGQGRAPNGESCNVYFRRMMAPNSIPIFQEETFRLASLELPIDIPHPRFVIGCGIRAPGCKRDVWATIAIQGEQVDLGNYRVR